MSPVDSRNVGAVIKFTNLTRLSISMIPEFIPAHDPWEALTSLSALQHLQIVCQPSLIPSLEALARLTSLDCMFCLDDGYAADLAPLTRLQK
jgi:hypothetical protein